MKVRQSKQSTASRLAVNRRSYNKNNQLLQLTADSVHIRSHFYTQSLFINT